VCIIIACKIGGDDGAQLPVLLQPIRTVQLAVDEAGNDARHSREMIRWMVADGLSGLAFTVCERVLTALVFRYLCLRLAHHTSPV
jgi:hypothetical protein